MIEHAALVMEYVTPAAANAAPNPVIGYATLALAVADTTPAPVNDYATSSPVIEYIAQASAVSCLTSVEQLPPAFAHVPDVAVPVLNSKGEVIKFVPLEGKAYFRNASPSESATIIGQELS